MRTISAPGIAADAAVVPYDVPGYDRPPQEYGVWTGRCILLQRARAAGEK